MSLMKGDAEIDSQPVKTLAMGCIIYKTTKHGRCGSPFLVVVQKHGLHRKQHAHCLGCGECRPYIKSFDIKSFNHKSAQYILFFNMGQISERLLAGLIEA